VPNTHKPPPETGKLLEERYLPGDPIPVPETIETNTDSAWALWQDSTQEPRPTFDETVPMGLEDMPPIRRG
jgi:hypothetical protein